MLVLGLRRGEALGLPWSRVSLDAAALDVAWQLQRTGRQLHHRQTKTSGSEAPLPLPGICVTAFRLQSELQATWCHPPAGWDQGFAMT